eukprot:CAMPEP_0171330064 /NCGR_PEP_ID=MMETSP0878-20121228/1740_1 /TAXON_ID=67004 /ORGANISM="Thalassiosira weissflogii, Strain CCMP1336" /LENGTH=58 /DNA_ID=CAMNT_0011830257 /DNA_START=217 /DNA_END=390 /DNA_ORIENTATION=-
MPQLSMKVPDSTPSKNILQNFAISNNPTRSKAAFVLPPSFRPSMNPAPKAITFFKAPQ